MKFHSHPYEVGRISPVPGQAKHSLSSEMTWQWLAARTQESPASHNQPGQRLKMIRRTKRKTLHLCMCVSSRINTGPDVTSACVLSTGKRHLGSNSLVAKLLGFLYCKQWCFNKVEKVKKKEVRESKQRDLETSLATQLHYCPSLSCPPLHDTLGRDSMAGAQLLYLWPCTKVNLFLQNLLRSSNAVLSLIFCPKPSFLLPQKD